MQNVRFEIVENANNFAIKSYGASYEELFANAAYGMFSVIQGKVFKVDVTDTVKTERVTIKSADRGELLVEFLNELLYCAETKKRAYGAFSFIKLTNNELVVLAYYTPLSKPKIIFKAATYRNLQIRKLKSHFEATVTFDI